MFRQMRRFRQQLSLEESIKILNDKTVGVLSLNGDDYPYGVPVNYVYYDNSIYIHCALTGHKLDIIKANNKVSFCVVGHSEIVEEKFTSYYKSVIIFGKATILNAESEKRKAIEAICNKYASNQTKKATDEEINGSINRMAIIRIDIDHISGKQAIELVRE